MLRMLLLVGLIRTNNEQLHRASKIECDNFLLPLSEIYALLKMQTLLHKSLKGIIISVYLMSGLERPR